MNYIEDIENDKYTSFAYDPLGLSTDLTLESKSSHLYGADAHLYNPATIHLTAV